MNLGLKDKVFIVIWDSKGLGVEISKLLAEEDAIPVLVGIDQQSILDIVKTIQDKNQKASYVLADVTFLENCYEVVANVIREYGRIDGLVNNGCVYDDMRIESGNYEGFMDSTSNYFAHYYPMVDQVLPILKKTKGAIVTIGSKIPGFVASNVVKNTLTREWANELLPFDIRVNVVIVAESSKTLDNCTMDTFTNAEDKIKEIADEMLFENRTATCEEIANTVVFLLSDKSKYTTGQMIFVDGEYSLLD